MTSEIGRTVRLFLVDGSARGLVTAEIINWSGKVLSGPRTRLADLLKRDESRRSGVYLLKGEDPENFYKPVIYIGEADSVAERLKLHDRDDAKDFWDHTLVVVSKDENLTKGHVRYLESRLIGSVLEAGRARLKNATNPPRPPLPEPDRADMEFFLNQIVTVLPVLGLDVFRRLPTSVTEPAASPSVTPSPTFVIETKARSDKAAIHAEAALIDGEFVVIKSSIARKLQGAHNTYAGLRKQLIEDGKLVEHPSLLDVMMFTEDIPFASPSAAASVVLNRNSNGRTEWKEAGTGQTYGDWQTRQLPVTGDEAAA
jgi:hypothetical protein